MLWAQWTQASLFLHSRTCMDSEFSSRLSASLEFLASLNYSLMSKGTNAHSHYPELEGTRSPKARSCTFAIVCLPFPSSALTHRVTLRNCTAVPKLGPECSRRQQGHLHHRWTQVRVAWTRQGTLASPVSPFCSAPPLPEGTAQPHEHAPGHLCRTTIPSSATVTVSVWPEAN